MAQRIEHENSEQAYLEARRLYKLLDERRIMVEVVWEKQWIGWFHWEHGGICDS